MARSKTTIPLLCLVCLLLAPSIRMEETPPRHVRVASATFFHNELYLFRGRDILNLKNKKEFAVSPVIEAFLDGDSVIGAAYASYDDKRLFLYGQNESKLMNSEIGRSITTEYDSRRKFLNAGPPDAAAKRNDKRYFFRGCEMAIKYRTFRWSETMDVKTFGLPCNVDAAWYEPEEKRMVILRGNQVWFWTDSGSVSGPEPFADTYTIQSWVLDPYEES